MLQWMGGSRRKVTNSRKSTHKRQKQYFEQRRRQQHQLTAGLEGYDEGVNVSGREQKEHRSLDVLSLLNLSTISQEGKPSHLDGREDPTVRTSTVKHHITEDSPLIFTNAVIPPDSFSVKESRSLSGYQKEAVSQKNSSDNHSKAYNRIDEKPSIWKTETKQELSLFDLLGDDGSNGNLEQTPVHEAHVAFSVEGLGKVAAETPIHSLQQHDKYVSYGCRSPSKASRRLKKSKKLNFLLEDLELESDAIMQDIGMPLSGSSLEFSSKLEKNFHALRDHIQMDDDGKIRTSFNKSKTLFNNEDIWDDANFLDKREPNMSWKHWSCQMDDKTADFVKCGNNELPVDAFNSSSWLKKRDDREVMRELNILESPPLKNQKSENDYDYIISRGTRHRSMATDFYFTDATDLPHYSCFEIEDARQNLSLLSEESSSSTAVICDATNISISNSTARSHRRCQNAISGSETKCGASEGRNFKNRDILNANNECGSGKSKRTPKTRSKPKNSINSPFQEKVGSHNSWLFEEQSRPVAADRNLVLGSGSQTSKTKHQSSGSKVPNDTFGVFSVLQQYVDPRLPYSSSKQGDSIKYSTPGNFFSENFGFCQSSSCLYSCDSPPVSQDKLRATKQDFSPDSPDIELKGWPPNSLYDAISSEEKLIQTPQCVSKDEEDKLKFMQSNCKKVKAEQNFFVGNNMVADDASDSENDPKCKEAKHRKSETSSSEKIPIKSESSVNGKEYHFNPEVPLTCPNANNPENEEPEERNKVSDRHSNCLDSGLMIQESFVLQLLCVHKLPKEPSLWTP